MKAKTALIASWTIIMLAAVSVFAAEDQPTEEPNRRGQGRQQMMQRWIEELNKAYDAGDADRVDQLVQRFANARAQRGPASGPGQGRGRGQGRPGPGAQLRGKGPQTCDGEQEQCQEGVGRKRKGSGPRGPQARMRGRGQGPRAQARFGQGRGRRQGFGPQAQHGRRQGRGPQAFAQHGGFGHGKGPRPMGQRGGFGRGQHGPGPQAFAQRGGFNRMQQLPPQAREKIAQQMRQRHGAGRQAPPWAQQQFGRGHKGRGPQAFAQRGGFGQGQQLPPQAQEKIRHMMRQRLGRGGQQAPWAGRGHGFGQHGRSPWNRPQGFRLGFQPDHLGQAWNRLKQNPKDNFWGD